MWMAVAAPGLSHTTAEYTLRQSTRQVMTLKRRTDPRKGRLAEALSCICLVPENVPAC